METSNKKIRVAILLHGQPRFFEHTYKNIVKNYTIDGCITHFFAHFWSEVGYYPGDDYSNTYINTEKEVDRCCKKFPIKNYVQENYNELDILGKSLHIVNTFFNKSKVASLDHTRYRYYYGQHLSLNKCFCLMEKYELKNNFKYDVVIKVRTDWVYNDVNSTVKFKKYIDKCLEQNTLTCLSVKHSNLLTKKETFLSEIQCRNLNCNNDALFVSDIFLFASRDISSCVFKDYLFYCISKKINYYNINQILGNICIVNNINIFKINLKPIKTFRLFLKDKCKNKWVKCSRQIPLPSLDCNIKHYIDKFTI